MVTTDIAREDLDAEILIKEITYRKIDFDKNVDLITGQESNNPEYIDYKILTQCTVSNYDNRFVVEGRINEGDLIGVFRYKYDKEANGDEIDPVLIPKSKDMIKFAGQWFSIRSCTPVTAKDLGISFWEYTASQTGLNDFDLEQ